MKIWTDANPDTLAWIAEDGTMVMQKIVPSRTSNEAEYLAILGALSNAPIGSEVEILSDSQLVVNQLSLKWSIKEDRLRALAFEVFQVEKNRDLRVAYSWIPRGENKAGKLLG
jgi:ribonuclease HI